jgi:hypothetical protein
MPHPEEMHRYEPLAKSRERGKKRQGTTSQLAEKSLFENVLKGHGFSRDI